MTIIAGLMLVVGGTARANLISTSSYIFTASGDSSTAGTVAQTISTIPGAVYQISFQGNVSAIYTPTILNFSFGNLFNASLTDDLWHQYFLWSSMQSDSSVATFDYLVTADAAASTLAFQYYLASEDYGVSIRNLTVNRVPDGATTAALLSAGLTAVFATRRWLSRAR